MVSINGMSPTVIQNKRVQKQKAVGKKKPVQTINGGKVIVVDSTKVATTTHQLKTLNASEYANARLQYDLPEGRSRKALEEYMDIMLQKRRDELAQLVGVDLYI